MRAVDIRNGVGPAEALFINDKVPTPKIKDGEVLVKIKAFGLNRMDVLQRNGHYPLPPHVPKTLGVEFSGTITEVSLDVTDFVVGDAVFGLAYGGAYAEYICVSAKLCIRKPEEMGWEVAAGIPEVWFTAVQALFLLGEMKDGNSILVHTGASNVGIALLQLLRLHFPSSPIYTTTSTPPKETFLRHLLGVHDNPDPDPTNPTKPKHHVINYRLTDFSAEILRLTNARGVDLIIDFPGQSHFGKNLSCAARDATIVMLGMLSGSVVREPTDIGPIVWKRLRILGSTLRSRDVEYQRRLRDSFVELALGTLTRGTGLKAVVERVMGWGEIAEAHRLMEGNKTMGKIVCLVE